MAQRKRFVALLLAVVMILQMSPVAALADAVEAGYAAIFSNVVEGSEYHTVTFKDGDKTVATQLVEAGNALVLPQDPAQEGYAFRGWFDGTKQATEDMIVTGDATFVAEFDPIDVYTVTIQYRTADGTEVYPSVVRTYTKKDTTVDTVESPRTCVVGNETLYPDRIYQEINPQKLTEINTTYTVTYAPSNVDYTVYHMALPENDDETKATQIYKETLPGAVGTRIVPQPRNGGEIDEFAHYTFVRADEITLTEKADANVVHVYYKADRHTLTYDTQGGSYVEPKAGAYGSTVTVYEVTGGCTKEEHTHENYTKWRPKENDESGCYTYQKTGTDWWGNAQYGWVLTCGKEAHTHTDACTTTYDPSPKRTGYTFEGWYTDKECTLPAADSITLYGDTTVYAKWAPAKVSYTVAYYAERANATDQWDYISSSVKTAYVGSTVSGDNGAGNFANYQYYHYNGNKTTSDVVRADSSTVVRAYYALNEYTLKFDLDNNDAKISIGGKEYTGSSYSFTAKLGEDISAKWPTADNITGRNFYGWNGGAVNNPVSVSKRFNLTTDLLKQTKNGTTTEFEAIWKSGNKVELHYLLQNADNDDYTDVEKYQQTAITNTGGFSAKQIEGFTYQDNIGSGNTYKFRYTRNTYEIEYKYGTKSLTTKSGVRFEKNINTNEYNWTPSCNQAGVEFDWKFEGWYVDPGCTSAYTFDKMPAANLVLYAKFVAPPKKVHLIYKDDKGTTQMVTLPKGVPVPTEEVPKPTREGYEFAGWYTEAEGGTRFILATQPVNEDITLYAHWTLKPLGYQVRYVDEAGNLIGTQPKRKVNAAYQVGLEITETAPVIAGYRVKGESVQTIALQIEPEGEEPKNVITFVYVSRDTKLSYKVRYVHEKTGEELKTSLEKETTVERVTVKAPAPLPGSDGTVYYPTQEVQSLELSANAEENVITFYYLPYVTETVEIHYYYENLTDNEYTRDETKTQTVENVWVGNSVRASDYKEHGKKDGFTYSHANPVVRIIRLGDCNDDENTVMELYYTRNSYQVEYEYTNTVPGASELPATATYKYGETVTVAPDATADGYTFSGWSRTDAFEMPAEDVTITGSFTANTNTGYKVEHYQQNLADDGYTLVDTENLTGTTGETATATPKTYEGFTYNKDAAGTVVSGIIAGSGTLVLKLYYDRNTYTVQYDLAGGKSDAQLVYPNLRYGTETPSIADPTRDGYTFNGWTPEVAATVTADATYTAQWTAKNDVSYTVHYYKYNTTEKVADDKTVTDKTFGTEVTEEAIDVTGFTLAGDKFQTITLDAYNKEIRFYYTVNSYNYTEKHVYDSSVETIYDADRREYNSQIEANKRDKTGYQLKEITVEPANGLMVDQTAGTVTGTMPAGAVVVTFIYERQSYNVSYRFTGDMPAGVTAPDGSQEAFEATVTVAADPAAVEGYTFHGWETSDATVTGDSFTMPAHDVEFVGNWTKNGTMRVELADDTQTYDGEPHSLTKVEVTVDGSETVTMTLDEFKTTYGYELSVGNGTGTDAGTYSGTVSGAQLIAYNNQNYDVTYADGTLTIDKRDVTILTDSATKAYDGQPLTNGNYAVVDGKVDALPADAKYGTEGATIAKNTITAKVAGTQTEVGSSQNNAEAVFADGKQDNFIVNYVFGTLTVTNNITDLEIASEGYTWTYDGQPHSHPVYTVKYDGKEITEINGVYTLPTGDTLTITGAPSVTTVADAEKANDNTFEYTLSSKDFYEGVQVSYGDLKIDKRPVTITGNSETVAYTGKEQTVRGTTVSGGSLVKGHAHDANASAMGTEAGTYPGTITEAGDVKIMSGETDVTANYDITTVPGTLTIAKTTDEFTVRLNGAEKVYDGAALKLPQAAEADAKTGKTTIRYALKADAPEDEWYESIDEAALSITNVGEIIVYVQATNPNYENTATAQATLKVTKRPVTITVNNASKVFGEADPVDYAGYELEEAGENRGPVGEELKDIETGLTVIRSNTAENAGTYEDVLTIQESTADLEAEYTNYAFTVVPGDFTITKRKISLSIQGKQETKVYNGEEQTAEGYAVKLESGELPANVAVEDLVQLAEGEEAKAVQTDVIRTQNEGIFGQTPMGLTQDSFVTNPNYDVTITKVEDGWIQITPKKVTITANSANYTYDGSAKTAIKDGTLYEIVGLLDGHSEKDVAVKYDGEARQTNVGDYEAVASGAKIMKGETDVTADYDIEYVPGRLIITKDQTAITITSANGEWVYDGDAHSKPEYTVTYGEKTLTADEGSNGLVFTLPTGDQLRVTSTASVTNVADSGEENNTFSYELVGAGNYGTPVTTNYGTLTITKRPVTMTSATADKLYDGTPLEKREVTASTGENEGFVGEQGATYNVTGTQTLVGSSDNTFTYELKAGTDANNYDIEQVFGKLTVRDEKKDNEQPIDSLVVRKGHTGSDFALNSPVEFTIAAQNIYKEARTITLTEQEGVTFTAAENGKISDGGRTATFENVQPGATVRATATHRISEDDILAGTYDNTVTAAVGDKSYNAQDSVTPAAQNRSYTLEKKVSNTPGNGRGYYTLGETVEFEIDVYNNGNLTLNNISVEELLEGAVIDNGTGYSVKDNVANIPVLAVNQTVTIIAHYVVQAIDLGDGSITNTVVSGNKQAKADFKVDDARSVKGVKTWTDDEDAYDTRPESIEVSLHRKVGEGEAQRYGEAKTVNAASGWAYSFDNLPAHTEDGQEFTYFVQEKPVTGYNTVYTNDGIGITNTLKEFTVTYQYTNTPTGASELPEVATYKYGQPVTVAEDAKAPGYTFGGWKTEDAEVVNGRFAMPEDNVVITGSFTAKTDTSYKVEYYLENLTGDGYDLKETENLTGATDTTAKAEVKSFTGFTFDADNQENRLEGNIAGDGSLVLKVYYTRNSYEVTYEYTGKVPAGASELPEKATYKYGATVEVAQAATAAGYAFSGWNTEHAAVADRKFTMPENNVKFTGSFTRDFANHDFAVEPYNGIYDGQTHGVTVENTIAGEDVVEYATTKDATEWSTEPLVYQNVNLVDDQVTSYPVYVRVTNSVDGSWSVKESYVLIQPVAIELTAEDANKEYDGTPLNKDSYRITGGAFIGEEGLASVTVEGSLTDVGEQENKITGHTLKDNTLEKNYAITYQPGKLKVTPVQDLVTVTIVENNGTYIYDGTERQVRGYESMTADKALYNVKTSVSETETEAWTAKGTDVATYDVGILAADFTNTNANFANVQFVIVDGTLKITPRPVTITVNEKEVEFNRQPQTVVKDGKEYAVEAETGGRGLLSGHTETLKVVYGEDKAEDKTLVGEYLADVTRDADDKPMVTISDDTADRTANYAIEVIAGKLTITGEPIEPDKTVASTPETAEGYKLGDQIEFTIKVENITNQELTDITVTDPTAEIVAGEGYTVADNTATIATLASGATVNVKALHTVTSDDILKGSYENTATIRMPDDKTFQPSVKTEDITPVDTTLTVVKTTTSTPKNNTAYALGETITYEITVTNNGNVPYYDVQVTDTIEGLEGVELGTIERLEPKASGMFTYSHVVTEADILAGRVVNNAAAQANSVEDPDNPDQPQVPEGDSSVEDPTDPKNGHLTVTKRTTSTPANGTTYALGEELTYDITVTNDGNLTIENITVTDTIEGLEGVELGQIASLEPGASANYTYRHVVTEADILAGRVVNNATAAGTSPDPENPEPGVEPGREEDPTDPKNGHLTVTKRTTSTPANGTAYVLGETIAYEIAVTNDGNLTVTGIDVTDSLSTAEGQIIGRIDRLEPGETAVVPFTYVVTGADLTAGSVLNSAGAIAPNPDPETDPETPDVPVEPGEVEVPVLNQLSLRVNYWYDEVGGEAAAASYTGTYAYGQGYNVVSPRIIGYTANLMNAVGTMTQNQTVDVVYVRNAHTLTVQYRFMDGTVAAADYVAQNLGYGDEYNVLSPALAGFTSNMANVTGQMPDNSVVLTVYYAAVPQPPQVDDEPEPAFVDIDEYGVPLGLNNVVMNVGDCFE